MNPTIAIYGATGFTGGLTARALRTSGHRLRLCGRDGRRLEALLDDVGDAEIRVAHVHDGQALRDAFDGASVVVNCAGPFTTLGEPVLEASIAAGANYLDTTGEQSFMRDMYERHEAQARRARVVVVNAMAFEVALGDFAAHLAAEEFNGVVDELAIHYAVDNFAPSGGTQLSILTSLSEPGVVWKGDRWQQCAPAAETCSVPFPGDVGRRELISFPSGEVITVPRHVDAGRVQTYVSLARDSSISRLVNRAGSLVGPALPMLARSPVGAFLKSKMSAPDTRPSDGQRNSSLFAILARAQKSFSRSEVGVSGADPYGVSAHALAYACDTLLANPPETFGVLAPSQAFPPAAALREIARRASLTVHGTS